jgi:hypothetical protein
MFELGIRNGNCETVTNGDRNGKPINLELTWTIQYTNGKWCTKLSMEHWGNWGKHCGNSASHHDIFRNRNSG